MQMHKTEELEKTRPILEKLAGQKTIDEHNSVDANLKLYDEYKQLEKGHVPDGMFTPGKPAGAATTGGPSAFKAQTLSMGTTPLRANGEQQSVYGGGSHVPDGSPGAFPRGPPMTDMTGVHPGTVATSGGKVAAGPLHAEDERELVQLMYEMIVNEQEIEAAKQSLAEQGDFNLMDAFQMIDDRNLGWVSAPQLLAYLYELGVFAHKDDVYNFTRRFDRDNDSRLMYSDFCEAITPKDSYYVHQLNNRKARYIHMKELPKKAYFTEQTRALFFTVFKTHFHAEQKIEVAKKRATRRPTFNIHDAFAACDVYRQGHLTRDDLKRVMQRNGFHSTESELNMLSARFDRKLMGVISYQEYMDEVLPRASLLGDIASLNMLHKR